MDLSPLTQLLVTREDADRLCGYVDLLREDLMKDQGSFEKVADKAIPLAWFDGLSAVLSENKVDMKDKIRVDEFLLGLKESVEKLPVVSLIIAADLKKSGYDAIAEKLREYVGSDVLLDIQKDASLVAGATIAYNGYIKDYSLKNSLKNIV